MGPKKDERRFTQKTIITSPNPTRPSANANSTEAIQAGDEVLSPTLTAQKLQDLLNTLREDISADIKGLQGEISLLRKESKSDLESFKREISQQMLTLRDTQAESAKAQIEMEKSLNDNCDRVTALEKSYRLLMEQNQKLSDKCMDLENRSRRQNLRLVGVPEDAEGEQPSRFVAELIQRIFGAENFNTPPLIDRAHRSLAAKPKPHERPRHLVLRMHYYADKEKVLRLARQKGKLTHNGFPIHFFPDVTPEVGKLRSSFIQVKGKLRAMKVPYSLYFPARLVVTVGGTRHTFTDPQLAEKFVQDNIQATDEDEADTHG